MSREPVHSAQPRRTAATWFAFIAVTAAAFASPNCSPLVVGALINEFSLNEQEAGLILSAELMALGLAALCSSPFMGRVSRTAFAAAGIGVFLAANIASMFISSLTLLTLVRVVAGASAGMTSAAINSVIAGVSNAVRVYSVAIAGAWLAAAGLALAMGPAIERFGVDGFYGALVAIGILGLGATPYLPRTSPMVEVTRNAWLREWPWGICILMGVFLVGIAMMAYYAFIQQIGERLGMTIQAISFMFALALVASVAGSFLAGAIGDRWGLLRPLIAGIVGHAAVIVMAVQIRDAHWLPPLVWSESLLYIFVLPLQYAVAAQLSKAGEWSAAASGVVYISTGVGPFLGGYLITHAGYPWLGWLQLVVLPPAIAAFLLVGRHIVRRTAT